MLFANERMLKITVPVRTETNTRPNIRWLIDHLCKHFLKDSRKDLFVLDDSVYVYPLENNVETAGAERDTNLRYN
jgi:hypothetical protein